MILVLVLTKEVIQSELRPRQRVGVCLPKTSTWIPVNNSVGNPKKIVWWNQWVLIPTIYQKSVQWVASCMPGTGGVAYLPQFASGNHLWDLQLSFGQLFLVLTPFHSNQKSHITVRGICGVYRHGERPGFTSVAIMSSLLCTSWWRERDDDAIFL